MRVYIIGKPRQLGTIVREFKDRTVEVKWESGGSTVEMVQDLIYVRK